MKRISKDKNKDVLISAFILALGVGLFSMYAKQKLDKFDFRSLLKKKNKILPDSEEQLF